MTTFSTNAVIAHNSNATYQAWVNEIYTGLVTQCGMTQTADTGQMAVPCVSAIPATNTFTGNYYVFRFNDTLQATSPVFIRFDFGSGASITGAGAPALAMTIGSSTNGAGTITGLSPFTSFNCGGNNSVIPGTGTTNYTSRYCYNSTQGFAGMAFKIGASTSGQSYSALFGFLIYRSVDNTGAPTATALNIIFGGGFSGALSSASCIGLHYYIDYSTSTSGTQGTNNAYWALIPNLQTTSSVAGTVGQIFPVFQYAPTSSAPGWGITNAVAFCITADIALNATVTCTVIGSNSLTYMQVGVPFGATSASGVGMAGTTTGILMLWQ